jgi:two-component system OmpR family response regulator
METVPHILVVDDDREIRDLLARFLTKHALRVSVAKDGPEMMRLVDERRFDLVVLDLMLPGEDGLSLCKRLRAKSALPVIMLTAMGEETDRIVGLEVGADDYMAKPFNPRELLARIKAVLRRTSQASEPGSESTHLIFMGFALDCEARSLAGPDGAEIELTGGEYDLLKTLLDHPGRVLTRDQLLDLTRGRLAGPFDRSIDIQISRLRKKIEPDPKEPSIIKTVRGGGYVLSCPVERGS